MRNDWPMTEEELEEQVRREDFARRQEQEIADLVDKLMPRVEARARRTLKEKIRDSLSGKPQRW
jgi:hypothetical protein